MNRHTFAEERQLRIAAIMRTAGRVSSSELAESMGTSIETIRKDLIDLEKQGILRRVHGGALHVESMTHEPAVSTRTAHLEQKRRIANAALSAVPTSGAVFLDAGSTTGLLAEVFPNRPLTVYTNTLSIAVTLAAKPAIEVHTLGGRVRPATLAEVGQEVIRALSVLQFDVAFLGTNAITETLGLATPDTDEAAVKAAMINSTAKRVLLADHTKFAQRSLIRYAGVEDLDLLITGRELEARYRATLAEVDVDVTYA